MDTFKIVATIEKRGVYFTVVPHKWEKNKQLFWPEHLIQKERELLRADPSSAPDELSWTKYKCVVKLNNIKDFEEGLILEKKFTECSDTEAEEVLLMNNNKNSNVPNRNYMFEETNTVIVDPQPVIETMANPDVNVDNTIIYSYLNEPVNITDINVIAQKYDDLKKDLATFKEEIKKDMKQIKDDMKLNFIKIGVYLDRIDKKIDNTLAHASRNETAQEDTKELFKFPITNDEEIQLLEQNILSDENYKSKLITYLTKIGGNTGQEDGTKIGYKIVDHVFSPKLLTNYSWTGISRKEKNEKKCFQNFPGLLNVFFKVIYLADNRHTIQKNNNLFKDGVLKHAKKRSFRKRSIIQTIEMADNDITTESTDTPVEEIEETSTE